MVERPEQSRGYIWAEEDDESEDSNKKSLKLGGVLRQSTTEESAEEKTERRRLFKKEGSEEKPSPQQEETDEQGDTPEKEVVSLEELKRIAVKEQAAAEIPVLEQQAENTAEGSPERIAAESAIALLRGVEQKADNPTLDVDPTIEVEYQKRLDAISDEEVLDVLLDEPEELVEHQPFQITHEDEHDNIAKAQPGVQIKPSVASPSANHTPPSPIRASSGGTGGSGFGVTSGIGGANTPPSQTAPNLYPQTPTETGSQPERSNKSGAFLMGGVVGYMLGRRGGRKRTEAKLQPEINKLDNEVKRTQQTLQARESDIKQAAREKQREQFTQKISSDREVNARREQEMAGSLTPVGEILKQTVKTPEVVAEHLGLPTTENKPQRASPAEIKQVEQLPTTTLLERAQALFINGVSVRNLYETNQIDRNGLVEIIQTAMKGGSIKEAFEKTELGQERQRERAREFRHDPTTSLGGASDDAGTLPAEDDTSNWKPLPDNAPLPNTPDVNSLRPVTASRQAALDQNDTHGSVDLNALKQPRTSEFTIAAVIAVGIAVLFIIFLFSL